MLQRRYSIISLILVCTLALSLSSCKSKQQNKGSASGKSTTIACDSSSAPLVNALIKDYNLNNKSNLKVEVMSTEEATKQIEKKKVDMIIAYEGLEEKKLKKKQIATDGIAIIVNSKNNIEGIALDQLRKIYTGEITNWKPLNNSDVSVMPLGYEEKSEIQKQYDKLLISIPVKAKVSKDVTTESSVESVKEKVAENANAIGFIPGIAVDPSVKAIRLNGLNLNPDNLKNELYPLKVKIYAYFPEEAEGQKKFIQYMGSDEGKKIMKKLGADSM